MIQYTPDGESLIDTNGNVVNMGNGDAFSKLLTILNAQTAAAAETKTSLASYTWNLANYQNLINLGKDAGSVAPAKPLQHVVYDNGESEYVAFVPPLPDPVANPNTVVSQPGMGFVPGIDKAGITYNYMLMAYPKILAMYNKMFPPDPPPAPPVVK
jgi:hypothetical protein